MNGKISALSIAAAMLLGAPAANAVVVLNSWNLNLSLVDATASDATAIDYVNVAGQGVVNQTVSGGSALGQPFTENGYLQLQDYFAEGAAFTTNFNLGTYTELFFLYTGLEGTLNGDGSITFDPHMGSVQLVLGDDGNTSVDGTDIVLANFDVISPSGGSDLDFYGGTAANATVDISLELIDTYMGLDIFTTQSGDAIDPGFFLHLVNTDSLLDPDVNPNPDNSGVDAFGNGESIITVLNNGQYNIARVIPAPGVLALFGAGLIGLLIPAAMRRRG